MKSLHKSYVHPKDVILRPGTEPTTLNTLWKAKLTDLYNNNTTVYPDISSYEINTDLCDTDISAYIVDRDVSSCDTDISAYIIRTDDSYEVAAFDRDPRVPKHIDDIDKFSICDIIGSNEQLPINGGYKTYKSNHDEDITKDDIIGSLIPPTISEFSIGSGCAPGTVCAPPKVVAEIGNKLDIRGDPKEIINHAKSKLDCGTEKCVVVKLASTLKEAIPDIGNIILAKYKNEGPTDSGLLSNIHIDNMLKAWSIQFETFFPYNFNMVNYASYSFRKGYLHNEPDTLATISFGDLYEGKFGRKFNCAGCVINSDTYQGKGKHWMALFIDARPNCNNDSPKTWSVEFFNSSGNSPVPEYVNWLVKTAHQMREYNETDIIKVTNIRHQQSKTECGVYSLFYIWGRLNGLPVDYFQNNPIRDQLMFEFRQHLFESPLDGKEFSWNEYSKTTKILWEKD